MNEGKTKFLQFPEATESTPILRKPRRRGCCESIPARYALALLGFLGFFNVYAMRVNLSVALVAMVNQSAMETKGGVVTACAELLPQYTNDSDLHEETETGGHYDWDTKTQAVILGAFFYGYVVTQIPGGILAQRWGAKWMFGVGILVTSVFTLLTPLAAELGSGYLIFVRVVEGLAEGVTFPAVNALIGWWVPKMERSRISTIIFTGSPVGTVAAMALSGVLSSTTFLGGWPSAFYVFGILGCIWFVLWSVLVHDNPSDHPRISAAELDYILQNQEGTAPRNMPWKCILTSIPVWALAATHFGQNWGFYTLLTEMPTYLSTILHFDIKQNGLLSSLPYILQAICAWIASYIADKLRESGKLRITTIRKIINSIAFFGPGICVLLVAFLGCQPVLIVVLLCAAMGFNGFMYSGFNVTHVDMSPEYAGTLMGITNCISNISGFLAPNVVGKITSQGQTIHNWGLVFTITSAVYFFCGSLYVMFCTAERQRWGAVTTNDQQTVVQQESREKKQVPPTIITIPAKE